MQDLSDYHLQFLAITQWLISKEHYVVLKQQHAYVRAFQPHFLSQIMNQLSIKMTDHHPNFPYKIQDVHKATCFILQGTLAPVVPTVLPSYPFPTPPVRDEYVKTETLTTMMAEFTKSMNEALVLLHPQNTFTRTHQDNVKCNSVVVFITLKIANT